MSNWTCRNCTLQNRSHLSACSTCGTSKYHPILGHFQFRRNNNILRFRLPKISFGGALNALDSALTDIGLLSGPSRTRSVDCLNSIDSLETPSNSISTSQSQNDIHATKIVSASSAQLLLDDEKSAASEYNRINEFCRKNHMPFIDDSFPHSKKSIGDFASDHRNDGFHCLKADNLVWLRPENICTKDGKQYRWSIFLDPKPSDIEQGCLGNCWFLSALAVIAERPDILDQIVLTKTYNPTGIYQIRLCVDGVWQVVIVDDFFPCHKHTRGLAFAVGRRNQLWVSLIEKALAKIFGSYSKLLAGRTLDGFALLTGAPCVSVDLENIADRDFLWARLLSMKDAGFIMGCSCGGGKRYVDPTHYGRVGLQARHAYSLLNVVDYQNHRLVRLRNPWGTFTWNGSWSNKWSQWTQNAREVLMPNGPEQGIFWISFEDFTSYFDACGHLFHEHDLLITHKNSKLFPVDMAQVRTAQNWRELRTKCIIEQFWGRQSITAYQLQIEESTELTISFYQNGSRERCENDLMVLLHGQAPKNAYLGELIARSPRRVSAFVNTGDVFLQGPALYTIFPISFLNINSTTTVQGILAVHSAKMVMIETFRFPSKVVTQSMIELCLKEGKINSSLRGVVPRYIGNDFSGHILMVDNYHEKHHLHVHCDCSQSQNVLSTRDTFITVDSIPPLHRQIVMLLTHMEPTQMYSIQHNITQRLTNSRGLSDWLSFAQSQVSLPSSTEHVPELNNQCVTTLHKPVRICS